MRVGVIGAGGFGTALARLLVENGQDTTLWCRDPTLASRMAQERENPIYLPGIDLSHELVVTADLAAAVWDREALVVAVPSHVLRAVVGQVRAFVSGTPWLVSASKGIEEHSLRRMSEVLEEVFGGAFRSRIAVLSGPSFAREIALGLPTGVSVASPNEEAARATQEMFHSPTFRVYRGPDVIGTEIGGAAKNVIAIATGVSDGLGLGHSARATLITRGVAEVARLAVGLGGEARTLSGLSGIGDLVLTCTADLSRNRSVGLRLGRGEPLSAIVAGTSTVAEGVRNSRSVSALARRCGVEMPITEEIRRVLHEGKSPLQALGDLLRRTVGGEF